MRLSLLSSLPILSTWACAGGSAGPPYVEYLTWPDRGRPMALGSWVELAVLQRPESVLPHASEQVADVSVTVEPEAALSVTCEGEEDPCELWRVRADQPGVAVVTFRSDNGETLVSVDVQPVRQERLWYKPIGTVSVGPGIVPGELMPEGGALVATDGADWIDPPMVFSDPLDSIGEELAGCQHGSVMASQEGVVDIEFAGCRSYLLRPIGPGGDIALRTQSGAEIPLAVVPAADVARIDIQMLYPSSAFGLPQAPSLRAGQDQSFLAAAFTSDGELVMGEDPDDPVQWGYEPGETGLAEVWRQGSRLVTLQAQTAGSTRLTANWLGHQATAEVEVLPPPCRADQGDPACNDGGE